MEFYAKIDKDKYLSSGEVSVIGEPKDLIELFGDEFEKYPEKGFRIHRPDIFCDFIKAVGGKRGKCAAFILKHKDPRNILMTRVSDLAKNAGVSLTTANDTIRLLRNSGSIKTVTRALMVNPGVDHSGDRKREAYLMKMYQNFENGTILSQTDEENKEDKNEL